MLHLKKVKFSYTPKTVLGFPDLDCETGSQWLILGQSGCGKTTLLHLIAGLLQPQEGQILINGTNIGGLSGKALDRFRGDNIGIVFQQNYLMHALSVEDNIRAAQYFAGKKQDNTQIFKLLEKLGLAEKAQSKPHELSQGQRQRVAIARALVNRPALLLADEPTSSLDDTNTSEVIALLENAATEEGSTLLIVTHDARLKNKFHNSIELSAIK